jgi:F-type H+-transporting ATPase subunit delta
MFRGVSRKLLAVTLPTGYSFLHDEMRVKDLEPTATNPTLQSLSLTLTRQENSIFKQDPVKSVTISTTSGYLGITPGHEYKISKLLPGTIKVEVSEGVFKTFFASGGFAQMNNIGSVDINTIECVPVDDIDVSLAEKELVAAQELTRSGKDEVEKAIGEIKVQVLEAAIAAAKEGSAAH